MEKTRSARGYREKESAGNTRVMTVGKWKQQQETSSPTLRLAGVVGSKYEDGASEVTDDEQSSQDTRPSSARTALKTDNTHATADPLSPTRSFIAWCLLLPTQTAKSFDRDCTYLFC